MVHLRLLLRYFPYFLKAKTRYDIHSPFLSEFISTILEDKRHFYAFELIKSLRAYLKQDQRRLAIKELGAGSKVNTNKKRSIRSLISFSAIDSFSGKILFRIMQLYKPRRVLELGTSLGISTLYLAYGYLHSKITTIEGSPEVAEEAHKNFRRFERQNIQLITGPFDEHLPSILKEMKQVDLAFIDGNHTYQATLRYFESILPFTHNNSILIFGDIHWSAGMERAWSEIKAHPKVTLSLDLFHLGIIFFREEQKAKESFFLIPSKYKPWRLGFFS